MARESKALAWPRVGSLAALILIVAALYLGKSLLVPFALALLLAFLLAPVVHSLERLRVGRVPAVVLTLSLASLAIGSMAWLVYDQVDQLADRLPSYRENVRHKLATIRGVGPLTKIQARLADLVPEPDEPTRQEAEPGPAQAPRPPPRPARGGPADTPTVPVTLVPAPPTPFQFLQDSVGPLLAPLSTAAVVFVLVLFVLVYQEDLRDRLIRLVSRHQLVRTTQAISDVTQRIGRYLLTTLIVNVMYGLPIGLGLWLLGVPNAALWGMLATVLRFIPYIGPWIAALFPIFLSFAISPGWMLMFAVVGLFLAMELVSNNLVEPWLYGRRTGLAPLAVIVAAIFWTWLWGTTGLLLAIPLTLVLAVLGRYVPQLTFLNILLRDEPGLQPDERYYQRLVAGDPEEAAQVAEEHARAHGRTSTYDAVVLPALRAARFDALDGRLDAPSLAFVRDSTRTLVEELSERNVGGTAVEEPAPVGESAGATRTLQVAADPDRQRATPTARVLLVSAGDETDTLTLTLLAETLQREGVRAEILTGAVLTSEAVQAIQRDKPDVVLIGGIPPYVVLRARHLMMRIRAANADVRLVLGLWSAEARPSDHELAKSLGVQRVASSIREAADVLRALAPLVGVPPRRAPSPPGGSSPELAVRTRP